MSDPEHLTTKPGEQYLTIQMGLTVAEQKLIWRIRQLVKQQCRGCMLTIESDGFSLFVLSKKENIGG